MLRFSRVEEGGSDLKSCPRGSVHRGHPLAQRWDGPSARDAPPVGLCSRDAWCSWEFLCFWCFLFGIFSPWWQLWNTVVFGFCHPCEKEEPPISIQHGLHDVAQGLSSSGLAGEGGSPPAEGGDKRSSSLWRLTVSVWKQRGWVGAAPLCREGGGWHSQAVLARAGHEVRVTSTGTIKMPSNVGVACWHILVVQARSMVARPWELRWAVRRSWAPSDPCWGRQERRRRRRRTRGCGGGRLSAGPLFCLLQRLEVPNQPKKRRRMDYLMVKMVECCLGKLIVFPSFATFFPLWC